MTISIIGNVGADLSRTQDRQGRQGVERLNAAKSATFPADVGVAAVVLAPVEAETVRELSEVENRLAASSTLGKADFDDIPSPQANVQAQARQALVAQTNKLSGDILQLLNE